MKRVDDLGRCLWSRQLHPKIKVHCWFWRFKVRGNWLDLTPDWKY